MRCRISASEWRAGNDAKARINGASLLHHLAALEGIGNGDEQATRLAQCRSDHRRIGGVAGKSGQASFFQFGDRVLVVLDDEQRHVACGQYLADDAADAAMAHQHHMVRQAGRPERLAGRQLSLCRGGGGFGRRLLTLVNQASSAENINGLSRIEMMAPAGMRSPLLGQQHQGDSKIGQNEGNSPIYASEAEIVSPVAFE